MIEIGVTSWTEKSLVESGWYPRGTSSAEGRLRYYASQFPIVENDSLYYALPPPERAALWVERTPPGFVMNVKAFATMTEHYTNTRQLPPDIRDTLKRELHQKRHVYPKDLGVAVTGELARRFREAIEPLRAAGRLGLVLFQYPVWFTATRDNEQKVLQTTELVPGCRVAIEFRNATWMNGRHLERTLSLLAENDLVYTCVDEPQGFPSSIPPIAVATADIALVRLHGRSASRWKQRTPTASERFRYLYTNAELREWVKPVQHLAEETESVHVLFNNCFSDYAVRNARELSALLDVQPKQTVRRLGSDRSGARPN